MASHAELIETCLELIAEKSDDIAPEVYQLFFAAHSNAEELFGHDPTDLVKGGMIVSLLLEVMNYSQGEIYPENIKRWVNDHRGYGVTLDMYPSMSRCMQQVIQRLLGAGWTQAMSDAWQAQFGILEEYLQYIYKS